MIDLVPEDTQATVEDKVRKLPENQGLNEDQMWKKIDEAMAEARKKGYLNNFDAKDQHGEA